MEDTSLLATGLRLPLIIPLQNPQRQTFQTGKCRVCFNSVKWMDMPEISFLQCFFPSFIWRHSTFGHSLQCAPNVTFLVLQEQSWKVPYEKTGIIPCVECTHHSSFSESSPQASGCQLISLRRILKDRLSKLGNVEKTLTLWNEWTCQRAVSWNASFWVLFDDISLFTIVFNVLLVSLF